MESKFIDFPILRGWDEVAELYTLIGDRGYIAGGYATWMASPLDEPYLPGDIDIFAVSDTAAWELTADICKERGWTWDMSPIAYTCFPHPLSSIVDDRKVIQVIVPNPQWTSVIKMPMKSHRTLFFNEFDAYTQRRLILESFDLDIIRGVVLDKSTVWGDVNLGQRIGRIMCISDPVHNLRRVMKYIAKGVTFENSELFKLFWAYASRLTREQRKMVDIQHGNTKGYFDVQFDDRFYLGYQEPSDTFWISETLTSPSPMLLEPFVPTPVEDVGDIPF